MKVLHIDDAYSKPHNYFSILKDSIEAWGIELIQEGSFEGGEIAKYFPSDDGTPKQVILDLMLQDVGSPAGTSALDVVFDEVDIVVYSSAELTHLSAKAAERLERRLGAEWKAKKFVFKGGTSEEDERKEAASLLKRFSAENIASIRDSLANDDAREAFDEVLQQAN